MSKYLTSQYGDPFSDPKYPVIEEEYRDLIEFSQKVPSAYEPLFIKFLDEPTDGYGVAFEIAEPKDYKELSFAINSYLKNEQLISEIEKSFDDEIAGLKAEIEVLKDRKNAATAQMKLRNAFVKDKVIETPDSIDIFKDAISESGKKSVTFPYGSAGFRKKRDKVVITNEQAAVTWATINKPYVLRVDESSIKTYVNDLPKTLPKDDCEKELNYLKDNGIELIKGTDEFFIGA